MVEWRERKSEKKRRERAREREKEKEREREQCTLRLVLSQPFQQNLCRVTPSQSRLHGSGRRRQRRRKGLSFDNVWLSEIDWKKNECDLKKNRVFAMRKGFH
jgi:hypothetical protein